MKQVNITINVPDSKFEKLMDFLNENFDAISVDQVEDIDVPEWQKEIVLKRMKNATEEDFFPLEDMDDKLKF